MKHLLYTVLEFLMWKLSSKVRDDTMRLNAFKEEVSVD
jgi:hypothetical protein